MNIGWIKVLLAALFEVCWVIGLKHADSAQEWAATIVCLAFTSCFLVTAGDTLPVGTGYSVFVGLGTAGTAVAEILLFGEPMAAAKLFFISTLLAGVIGLKLVTPNCAPKRGG